MQELGKRLRERARELELSDAEVARRAGLSERRYGHYVRGRNEPDLQTLLRICTVLATTPNELLGIEERPDTLSKEMMRYLAAGQALQPNSLRLAVGLVEQLVKFERTQA